MKSDEKVLVAIIGKNVALRGEHKLHLKCDFPEQFKPGEMFELQNGEIVEIESYIPHRSLVKFKNFNSVEESKHLINQPLFTTIQKSRKTCYLKDGEFFWFDVIGSKVIEKSTLLGVVKDIERIVDKEYLIVKSDKKYKNIAKSFYIPYIKNYIIKFDPDSKIVFTQNAIDILYAS